MYRCTTDCSLVDPLIFPYTKINNIFNDFMNTFVTDSICEKGLFHKIANIFEIPFEISNLLCVHIYF